MINPIIFRVLLTFYLLGPVEKVSTENKRAGCLLQPPTPIIKASKWPTYEVKKTTLEDFEAAADTYVEESDAAQTAENDYNNWDNDDFADNQNTTGAVTSALNDLDLGDDDEMGDWGDDLDFGDDMADDAVEDEVNDMDNVTNMGAGAGGFNFPAAGRPAAACWTTNSSHASVHSAAGAATSALQLLNRQISVCDFSRLKAGLIGNYLGSVVSVPGVPGSGSISVPLLANDISGFPGEQSLPRTALKMRDLVNGIRSGYRFFQGGKFKEALGAFTSVLEMIPLAVTENRNEANEVKEMLEICKEYITAVRIKNAMAEHATDPVRCTELSAYFTHCNLQPAHLLLALRLAMANAFKHKNFITTAGFARRLLELPDMSSERNADLRVKATKFLQKSEQEARNEHDLNYNPSSTFTIDCERLVPVYAGEESVSCSYCGSIYGGSAMKNKICLTCKFCTVGVTTLGLVSGS